MRRDYVVLSPSQIASGEIGQQDIDYRLDRAPFTRYYWNGTDFIAVGAGAGGGGTGYLGSVASQAAMTGLDAAVGDECLRTDLGTGGLRYECVALPATVAANWQPIQGTLADGTLVTVTLVDGKLPRTLAVDVASGCQVTVTIGGVTQPVLVENATGSPTRLVIGEPPTAAQPTTLTIQRTAGSGTTSTWSLLDVSTLIEYGVVPTYAALLAAYPEKGAALAALPAGTQVYVENMGLTVRRSYTGKYWVPDRTTQSPFFTGSNAHWTGPANTTALTSSANHLRKWIKAHYYRMPGGRPGTISRISIYQTTNGTAGVGTDSCSLKLYAANPDGSPIVGQAPLFVWDWNAAGSGGAGVLSLVSAGANATRIHADLPGGAVEVPAHFWLAFSHDLATAITAGCTSQTSHLFDGGPADLNGTDVANVLTVNRLTHYAFDDSATAWSIGYAPVWGSWEYGNGAAIAPHLKVTG